VRGAELKQDDVVRNFFVCSTHDWILFFTNYGRVYRLKAYELPEASRTARGQHVANLLEFQPGEHIAQVIQIQGYEDAEYLVLSTAHGRVKKSRLADYDSSRSGGLIAINLNEGDRLIGAALCSADDDLLLVSEEGQAIRFTANDDTLRPMGRATAGVKGMRFRGDDQLLAMCVVRDGDYLLVATSGGYGKRTAMEEYPVKGRGGLGVVTFKYTPKRGKLIGALAVDSDDQIFAITSAGGVIRTEVGQIRPSSRQTMGVRLVNLEKDVELFAIDRNVEGEGEETAEAVAINDAQAPTLIDAPRHHSRRGELMATRKVTVHRISPMSMFRTALALSLAGLVAWILCVVILFLGMQLTGVLGRVNDGFGGGGFLSFGTVLSIAALIGAINALLVTVLAPIGAVLYNSFVDLFGGLVVETKDGANS
jgi:hypothetical protein